MNNMKEYMGIDLANFYQIPANTAFLIVYDCKNCKNVETRKVKIADYRYLCIDYPVDSDMEIFHNELLMGAWLSKAGHVSEIYNLDERLLDVCLFPSPVSKEEWQAAKIKAESKELWATISFNKFVSLVKTNEQLCLTTFSNGGKVCNTGITLRRAVFSGTKTLMADELISKCKKGEEVDFADLDCDLNALSEEDNVYYNFESFFVEINRFLSVRKKMIRKGEESSDRKKEQINWVKEEFACDIYSDILSEVPTLLRDMILAEDKDKLIPYMYEHILNGYI